MLTRTELGGARDDRLYFAQVREDPILELAAFKGHWHGPIAVVSSGGCTALSLVAEGAEEVIGVDLNRTQNHLVEFKAAAIATLQPEDALALLGGSPASPAHRLRTYASLREHLTPRARTYWDARPRKIERGVLEAGTSELLIRAMVRAIRLLVHPRSRMNRMLRCQTVERQRTLYQREWDTLRWRLLFRLLCNRLIMHRAYDPAFFEHIDKPGFAAHFLGGVEEALTRLPVGNNYFLHHMLSGHYPPATVPGGLPPYLAGADRKPLVPKRLTLVDANFLDYLRTLPDSSMAGFSLSNICEWLSTEQIDELFAEIVRTAMPGARLCFRNFLGHTEVPPRWREAVREERGPSEELMRLDRSMCQRRFAVCMVDKDGVQ